jgi:hypothetical protein
MFSIYATMSDDDDYLSDKFLLDASSTSSAPKTYLQRRKEAERRAKLKNEQNRLKSRRQRELESREEGLSKSLFERAKEEEDAGVSSGNKALSIMMKMGFKPGQSLGQAVTEAKVSDKPKTPERLPSVDQLRSESEMVATRAELVESQYQHKTEPLPLNEWAGSSSPLLRHHTNETLFSVVT